MTRIECCGVLLSVYDDWNHWMSAKEVAVYNGIFWAFDGRSDEKQFQPAADCKDNAVNGAPHCGDALAYDKNLYACRDCLQKAGVIW